jgi:nitrogen fixation/metabolism regulation signal transduction histidine kinase
MKTSIRSKRFTMGMVLFLVIILLLSISSAFYLNRLSGKTSAILKENHYSVVYARDMSDDLMHINQGVINSFIADKNRDTLFINQEFMLFNKSLESEKNNITEVGEDQLVSDIETNYKNYHDSVLKYIKSPIPVIEVLNLQKKYETLYQQLMLLSQINGKAIEDKTDDAKVSAKKATVQMTFIGTICFLIAYGFTFIFSSYFNERFYKLYNGIKEIVSGNYNQKIYIEGNDELSEISLAFNEMAEKLSKNKPKISVTLQEEPGKNYNLNDIQELKNILFRIKSAEEQAIELISRFDKKQ